MVLYRSGIIGNNIFWLRCPFARCALKENYCNISENHNTLYRKLAIVGPLSTTVQHVRPTASGPAALPATTSSHAATTRLRSSATRHDAPAAASPATTADPSRSRQSWLDLRPIHQQAEATSFRKPPTPAGNGAAASSKPSCTTTRSTADAGAAGATGPNYTGGTGSEGVSAGEVVERAGSEAEDLYIEWAAEGYVQRYALADFTFLSLSTRSLNAPTVKRALRAIDSPAYTKARGKNPLLPEITTATPTAEIFKLLPLSLLALRVSKSDPHEGHGHAPSKPQKRVKGLWTVKIEQQQDINDDLHYVWLYEGPQWRTKVYAVGALILIMTVVMFPLWPIKLRIGVWYLSMGFLGLLGLFFAMAIFRLILFCVTVFTVPPGLWLYPNLFEDVGFFDSFRPVWGWQEVSSSFSLCFQLDKGGARLIAIDEQDKKAKKAKKLKKGESGEKADAKSVTASQSTNGTETTNGQISKRHTHAAPRVEEVEDE